MPQSGLTYDVCPRVSRGPPEELKRQGASLESAQAELSQVKVRLKEAQAEMENIKAVATVSESTKQEAIDQVKRQWQEEVASLQAIMKGNGCGLPEMPLVWVGLEGSLVDQSRGT